MMSNVCVSTMFPKHVIVTGLVWEFESSRRLQLEDNMILIGDVHGKFGRYKTLTENLKDTIQIGDMGVGFMNFHGEYTSNPPYDHMVKGNHRFIRGNHDNPGVCRNHKQWIKDGTVENDVMFVGGGYSIDKVYRTEGIDWWRDEEVSKTESDIIIDTYLNIKPRVMITHDCPIEIVELMHPKNLFGNSFTQKLMQYLFEHHKPELWVYGHHHMSFRQTVKGTKFVCLNELELMEC